MSPKEAAEIIGCSPQHVRHLARTGKIKAKVLPVHRSGFISFEYNILRSAALAYRDRPTHGGYPRGNKRKGGSQ